MIHLSPIAELIRAFSFMLACFGMITSLVSIITNRALNRSFQLALVAMLTVSFLLMFIFDVLGV